MIDATNRYLSIVAPVNEVVKLFNGATDDTSKCRTIEALSVALRSVGSEIQDAEWPTEAQAAARRLVAATHATAAAAGALIADLTDESATVFASEVGAMTDASSTMRAALGLPLPCASFS